jgi:alpha-amylase
MTPARVRSERALDRWAVLVLCLATVWVAACSSTPVAREPQTPLSLPQEQVAQEEEEPVRVQPHGEWREAILYFVIVDRFADGDTGNNMKVDRQAKGTFHGGDLRGLIQQLDELADLGVTALWITPVVKNIDGFVTGAGFPDWGYHGYWADDFNRLDPRFGSEEDLAELVEEAHARGIAVLLDVVYNHVGYGSQYISNPDTRAWFRTEEAGTCGSDDLTSCLAGLPDFKTELPEVADYLMTAHLGLAKRVGLDGFRLDTVKHVTHEFWQEHRRRIDEELSSDFFLVGEVWGGDAKSLDPWFAGDEMDAGFDFSFQGSSIGFLQGRGRAVAFNRYLEKRHEVREGYLLSHYLSSHDVQGALSLLEGDMELFRLAALLQFTSSGLPVIFYGEEVGAHPALWRGDHTGLQFEQDLLVFQRRDSESDDVVVVALNRGAEPAVASFERPPEWQDLPLRDRWLGEPVAGDSEPIEATVPPRSARIITVE